MLRWRLLSASIIISLLLGFIFLDYHRLGDTPTGLWMIPLLLVVTTLATSEALTLLKSGNLEPVPWAVYGGTLMVVMGSLLPIFYELSGSVYPPDCPFGQLGWATIMTGTALIVLFVSEMLRYEQPGRVIMHVASGLLAVVYVGLLASFLIALRRFHNHQWGMVALISVVAVVKVSDSGAYFVGRMIGKNKLLPNVSPGKTFEGAAGGVLFSLGIMFVYVRFNYENANFGQYFFYSILSLIVTLASILGDLFESLHKRIAGVKDSGILLPGHGGLLDRIDSLTASAPIFLLAYSSLA